MRTWEGVIKVNFEIARRPVGCTHPDVSKGHDALMFKVGQCKK